METPPQIRVGTLVETPQGDRLGRVVKVEGDQLLLSRGMLWPREFTLRRADARLQGGVLITTPDRLSAWFAEEALQEPPGATQAANDAPTLMPLYEEALTADAHVHPWGHLRLHKTVVTEQRTLTVTLRREELRVERVSTPPDEWSEPAVAMLGPPLEERVAYLPLYEEDVEIVKRPRVREWVRLTRSQVTSPRTFVEEVRQERVAEPAERPPGED